MEFETEGKKKLQTDVKMNKTTKMKNTVLSICDFNESAGKQEVRLAHIHGLTLTHSAQR